MKKNEKKKSEKSKKSSKKNEIQLGNFIVGEDESKSSSHLYMKSVSGSWSVRYDSSNIMYLHIKQLLMNESMHNYLAALIHTMFISCNNLFDLEFIRDFTSATATYHTRMGELLNPSEEERDDERDLKIVKMGMDLDEMAQTNTK